MRILSSARPRPRALSAAALAVALALAGALVAAQPGEAATPATIDNPSFETGDLTGWNVVEGQAFTDATVSDATGWGWGCCFNPDGVHHLWGAATAGGDTPTGRMRSSVFTLDGTGEISFLIGGGNDPENLYVALHRASDDAELMRATNTAFADSEILSRVVWDASDHLGQDLYLEVVDTASAGWGHINLDDVRTYTERSIAQIANPGFETGDLTGWTATGQAFGAAQVTDRTEWGWGGPFGHDGRYHLWGANNGSDDKTGTLTSSTFSLGGTGEISFLIGGGNDLENLYVALHRASDGAELMRATNTAFADSEAYSPVRWNAADHIGEELYFRIVDDATGGWGHINVDAFDTADDVVGHEFDNAGFEAGSLQGWTADGEAFSEASVSSATRTPAGEPFGAQGTYHLWGGGQGDCLTGTLTSPRFVVGGSGEIRLLLGGTDDPDVYVAAESVADGQELARVGVGTSRETYQEVGLDLAAHVGETVRLRLVDGSPTGHLNVDDIRTLLDGTAPGIDTAAWSTPTGTSGSHCAGGPSGATPQNA
ncbi:hypothetical protein [Promicromonospora sp. MEB111]|uniref:hypothetical protein n=1 Tax=Promicromonospora sp. MEB111 TaxID=3040301 RepID=UPI00254B92B4|nr:hypothetical protein [Promicromonospora sp. MEB111]